MVDIYEHSSDLYDALNKEPDKKKIKELESFYGFDTIDFQNLANSKNIRRIVALLNFTGTITLEQVSLIINFKVEKTDKILRRLNLFDIVWYRKIDNTYYASLSTKGYRFFKYLNNEENK